MPHFVFRDAPTEFTVMAGPLKPIDQWVVEVKPRELQESESSAPANDG